MSKLLLSGTQDHYLFDPENESTVLKRNGKFGSVYAGASVSDQHHVVIKFLNPELNQYPEAVKQFSLEADLNLSHPYLRKTFEVIGTENKYFLVQEYINGLNLKSFLLEHSSYRNIRFILNCAIRILDALDYLHSEKIIHCDIKPANILIEYDGKRKPDENNPLVKLIDFGQAKTDAINFVAVTKPFSIIYSPPEQVLHFHELINPSSDLFALGITLYELLAGENPYGSAHPEMIMHKQISGDIEESEKIPGALFKIIQKAVAKNKFPLPPNQMDIEEQKSIVTEGMKKRFQTANEMKTAMEDFLLSYSENKFWLKKIFG
ncbi:MAG: serine/threonine-protein kinase [Bacteroidia bacterium]